MRRTRSGLGALAAALAALTPGAARAGPTAPGAVLELAATRLLLAPPADGRALALPVEALRVDAADRDDDGDPSARLPAWLKRIIWRWDTYDGQGYGFRPAAGRDGWFVGGEYERRQGPQPLVLEPEEEPDSPRRRVVGDDARSVGAVLDLSELPRLLLALGAGGGHRHLHAYLGWAVTVADPQAGR